MRAAEHRPTIRRALTNKFPLQLHANDGTSSITRGIMLAASLRDYSQEFDGPQRIDGMPKNTSLQDGAQEAGC